MHHRIDRSGRPAAQRVDVLKSSRIVCSFWEHRQQEKSQWTRLKTQAVLSSRGSTLIASGDPSLSWVALLSSFACEEVLTWLNISALSKPPSY